MNIFNEQYYWDKIRKIHKHSKLIRSYARNNPDKSNKQLAKELDINRKTLWALINGLTTPSKELMDRLHTLEEKGGEQ
jgi:DNA-binding XRE family transcriptional regulator